MLVTQFHQVVGGERNIGSCTFSLSVHLFIDPPFLVGVLGSEPMIEVRVKRMNSVCVPELSSAL